MSAPETELMTRHTEHHLRSVKLLLEQISDQNVRYTTIQEAFSDDPEIRDLASRGVGDEQEATLTDLIEANNSGGYIYADLLAQAQSLDQSIDENKTRLMQLKSLAEEREGAVEAAREEYEKRERKEYDAKLAKLQQLSPRILDEAKVLLDTRLNNFAGAEEVHSQVEQLNQLMDELAGATELQQELVRRRAVLESIHENIGEAWPRPLAISDRLVSMRDALFTLDQMPVEPKLNRSGHERFTQLRERHIDQPEASLYTALYLSEKAGQIATVEEIAAFLYSEDTLNCMSDYNLRSRVTTLLGPESGSLIRKVLSEEGYLLQYGWRVTLKEEDGHVKIVNRRRIYRAIKFEDIDQIILEDVVDGNTYNEFDRNPELDAIIMEIAATKPQSSEPIDSVETKTQEVTVNSSEDQLPPEVHLMLRADDGGDAAIAASAIATGEQQSPAPDAISDTSRTPAARKAATTRRSRHANRSESNGERDWEKAFRTEVGQTISTLEEWGLMTPEGIKARTAGIMAKSTKFATAEAISRLEAANLMSGLSGVRKDQLINQVITPREMVLMYLFNNHSGILGKGQPRQRRAVQIIEDAIAKYFDKPDHQ